jgi:hydrogenase/urease accessory protein HupE
MSRQREALDDAVRQRAMRQRLAWTDRSSPRALLAAVWLCLQLAFGALPMARAHPLSPPSLAIEERQPAQYEVSFRRSRLAASRLEPSWPRGCQATSPRTLADGDQLTDAFRLTCPQPLEGQTIRVFGLVELELSVLVYLAPLAGEPVRALLSAERASFVVPERASPLRVLRDYIELGVEHLLSGPDHILFVLGLLLLMSGLRARLLALTAFTLGHSLTLCLSALSVIALPQPPVEVGIAASLLVLALEVLERRSGPSQGVRRAWLMAGGFGLLHGLGFASALIETGLPAHAVPLSLLGFNLGVELGQLIVVGLLAPCLYVVERLRQERVAQVRVLAAYAIGSLAAMWCLERTLSLLSPA